jgi:hypothetical protein
MGKLLTPDMDEAARFLNLLDPTGTFTFQTFDDNAKHKDWSLARVYQGTLMEHADTLTQLQQRRAGVFVTVNRGDGIVHPGDKTCRTAKNIIAVRALFADLDGAPLQPALEACYPDIVIESSPERWHCYWLTNDCPLDDFRRHQKAIAAKFGSDPKVIDLPRVMRLPGFWHQKAEPFMTHMIFPGAK